jgi:methionine biosynthesis protein MetW
MPAEGFAATDESTRGLSTVAVDPLRYDRQVADPAESTGIILGMIPHGARVLDVGCGTGSISCLVRDHCQAQVVGLEPHAGRAATAASRGIDARCGVLTPELFAELGAFDVVLFADVLEHLADPTAQLVMARSFLKKDGAVIASVPNVAHWTVRWNLLRGRFDYGPSGIMDATHLRWFTRESLARLFLAAGLRPQEIAASAGLWMQAYLCDRPWRWLEPQKRNRLIRKAVARFPSLCGCQFVVKASAEVSCP